MGMATGLESIDVVPPIGSSQREMVPDTLDLAERAELAISAITNMLDVENDYQLYADGLFNRRPPVLVKCFAIPQCGAKHLEAMPLLRMICGSQTNIEVDKGFMECLLGRTGDDGCVYTPLTALANPEFGPLPMDEPFGDIMGEGRLILAMCMWHQRDQNPLWPALIEKKIKRLTDLAVQEDDYVYFPRKENYILCNYFTRSEKGPLAPEREGIVSHIWTPKDVNSHGISFMAARSMCMYYRLTGHQPALDLAGKIIRGTMKRTPGFAADGRWLINHFHTSAASLLAMLEYALITEDDAILELVRKSYEYGKAVSGSLTGFFPEFVPGTDRYLDRRVNVCETCEVADMIGLALKLTAAGLGDYWEDADRWIRNQLVENQLTPDKLDTLVKNIDKYKQFEEMPVQPWESTDLQRGIGGFAGKAFGNDWGVFLSHACCTPNTGRTLYWIWDSIVTKQNNEVRVNLHLNRATRWLDVNSYMPYEGKVVLKVKETDNVAIRAPQWTDRKELTCKIDDTPAEFIWRGNYVHLQGLQSGQRVSVEFPIEEKTLFNTIGRIPCRLTIRGNTVVEIDPRSWERTVCPVYDGRVLREDAELCPLYQREHYRQNTAPMKKVTRFVSEESLQW